MSMRQINFTGLVHRVLNVLRFPFMSLQSIDFHERGKNHKENVAAKISEVLICGKIPFRCITFLSLVFIFLFGDGGSIT